MQKILYASIVMTGVVALAGCATIQSTTKKIGENICAHKDLLIAGAVDAGDQNMVAALNAYCANPETIYIPPTLETPSVTPVG